MNRPSPPRRRSGFTLVEILVVVMIIGILMALLVPAIWGAVIRARETAVLAVETQMGQSLTDFKTKYGEYPPSRIILMENGDYSLNPPTSSATYSYGTTLDTVAWAGGSTYQPTPGDQTYGQLVDRSLLYLRKFFPRALFSTSGPVFTGTPPPGSFHDFNGDQRMATAPILLQGHECLVFFLGGVPNPGGGVTGFSKNPAFPFVDDATATNRAPSLFEFKADHLIDDDGDGMPGYVDDMGTNTEARFFAYFSAYGSSGRGNYDPNDVNLWPASNNLVGADDTAANTFQVSFSTGAITSPVPNPYTSSVPAPTGSATFLNPQSFQILSPGRDRLYGAGGQFVNSGNSHLPAPPANRGPERDNLGNFYGSRLD